MSLLPQQDQDAPAARCRWRCCSCILAVAGVLLSWSFTHVLCSVFLVAFTVLPHIRCIFGLSTCMLLHIDDVETVTNEAIHAVITLPCRTRVHLALVCLPARSRVVFRHAVRSIESIECISFFDDRIFLLTCAGS